MNPLKELGRTLRKASAESEKRMRERTRYGVFVWTNENRYPAENAVKVYHSETLAQRFCDADYESGNAHNYVVRPILLPEVRHEPT